MLCGNRAALLATAALACIVAGCGATAGIPASGPTPLPLVTSRPLAAGDTFAYAGTTVQTIAFNGSSPGSNSQVTWQVAQSVTVGGPTSYNGLANAFDFKTSETDTAPLQQIALTTDAYYALQAASGTTQLLTSGSTSSDSLGQKTAIALHGGNQLADELPEAAANSWSNNGAQTIVENEADGSSDTRTYAADGSYTDAAVYPQSSQFTPQPAPLVASIVENADGSGSYSLPLFGATPNATISFGSPDPAGRVPIVVDDPGPVEEATPGAFYSPGPLYKETDVTNVNQTIPAACHVAATFGSKADALVRTATRIDTVLGTIENTAQTAYVVPVYGVACIVLNDTTNVFYDYSGQSNQGYSSIAFTGGTVPVEVDTIATTLGLTSATVQPSSLRRGVASAESGPRIAMARTAFMAAVERARAARARRAFAHIRAALARPHAVASPGGHHR